MDFIKNSIILDTETTGLRRGAGIHELAIFDLEKRALKEWILNPNYISIQSVTPQDITRLSSSSRDIHTRALVTNWKDAIAAEPKSRFLEKNIHHYPHLSGLQEDNTERIKRFQALGISADLGNKADVQDVISKDLPNAITGKTVWIQNTSFESKQIGAQLAADGINWKHLLETRHASPDPFYVTGKKVNEARVEAQFTGDWSKVFKAYRDNTPKPGETAVRDIQDVIRATMSLGRANNLSTGGRAYSGASIDIQHQLLAAAEGNKTQLGMRELHRAGEDAAIHSAYVLEKHWQYATVLDHIKQKTPEGRQYLADGDKGILGEIQRYFGLYDQNAERIEKTNYLKRLGRAYTDIETDGRTIQSQGVSGFYTMLQDSSDGLVKVPRVNHKMEEYTDFNQAADFIKKQYSHFNLPVDDIFQQFKANVNSVDTVETYIESQQVDLDLTSMTKRVLPQGFDIPKGMPKLLPIALGLTVLGVAASFTKEKPREQLSLLGYNYYQWLDAQEGMQTQGVGAETRKDQTDFGSPYRGSSVSQSVLDDQKMLEARQKHLRQKYMGQMYDSEYTFDPSQGVKGLTNVFNFRSGYKFIHDGSDVTDYQGTKGSLKVINLDDYKVKIEDADTITLAKKGFINSAASFFGLGEEYSFRLAGVDAPETAHADRRAQPYSEEAKLALETLLTGKNRELVFNTQDLSYGRMVSALIVDGKNINYEMIKRGNVAHLPYGKSNDAIVDYRAMANAEKKAISTNRGLWQEPFFHSMAKVKDRPTFNTLANVNKVVESTGLMNLTADANRAQANNEYFNSKPGYLGSDDLYPGREMKSARLNTSVYSRRKYQMFNKYTQAQEQKALAQSMFVSPINHTRQR